MRHTQRPLWAWLVLAVAVLAMSSGGVWFAALDETPPVLKACWRLTATALCQIPLSCVQLSKATVELRAKLWGAAGALCLGGSILALHFAAWSWSVDNTSLSHSLLFVCSTPLLLVGWSTLVYGCVLLRQRHSAAKNRSAALALQLDEAPADGAVALPGERGRAAEGRAAHAPLPPSLLECLGAALGFAAAALLAASAGSAAAGSSSHSVAPTLAGDAAALAGAAAMGLYLAVGGRLRQWMPLWIYAFAVTAVSALVSGVGALAMESGDGGPFAPVSLGGLGPSSMLGWLGSWRRFGCVAGAAVTSGILGHTGANLALEYISPLIISVALLLEPVVGSLLGYAAGFQGAPDAWTALCGPALIGSATLVTLGDRSYPYNDWVWSRLGRLRPASGTPSRATLPQTPSAASLHLDAEDATPRPPCADGFEVRPTESEGEQASGALANATHRTPETAGPASPVEAPR